MKKILVLFLCIVLCACSASEDTIKYNEFTKVADHLYEITCNDIDYDYLFEDGIGNVDFLEYYGCSGIRSGNYLGRNFDFVAGDASEIVVKTIHSDDRYASIGMSGGLLWLGSEFMDNGSSEDARKLVPLLILDGINEKGLTVEINCVNSADVGGLTMHTNPGKKQVAQLAVVRYLLDNAASADEAIEILQNIDIVNTRNAMGLQTYNFEIHFLICDANNSYVVEFNNSKPDGEKLIVLKDEEVMTNFYLHLSNPEENVFPTNSMGVERYRKLYDNKQNIDSFESMKELMRSVRYTNSNRLDGEYDPGENNDNKYTCFSDHPVFGEESINYDNYLEHIDTITTIMKDDSVEIAKVLQDPLLLNPKLLWCTSHSSVYDIVNKKMSVAIFERFDKYYEYSISELNSK